jgi:hypothetical protein
LPHISHWQIRDYDPHGPCGPTAFWKISDREPRSDDHQVELNDFLPIVDGYEHEFELEHEHEHDFDAEQSDYSGPDDEEDQDVELYLPVDVEFIEIDG